MIKQAQAVLLGTIGIDVRMPIEGCFSGCYSRLRIYKALLQFYKVPSKLIHNVAVSTSSANPCSRKFGVAIFGNKHQYLAEEPELYYDARMPLYAISRARVQYVGSCIPLFRFKHSLFEALMSSIHESEIRPAYSDLETLSKNVSTAHLISKKQRMDSFQHTEYSNYFEQHEVLQDKIKQERFLMRKFLEFMSSPYLSPLLLYSARGHTLKFVEHFNSLTETQSNIYSRYKINLYDVNQFKFIVQVHTSLLDNDADAQVMSAPVSQDIYLVHYNGFVFGANFANIITIREREKKNNLSSYSSSDCNSAAEDSDNQKDDEDQSMEELGS